MLAILQTCKIVDMLLVGVIQGIEAVTIKASYCVLVKDILWLGHDKILRCALDDSRAALDDGRVDPDDSEAALDDSRAALDDSEAALDD